MIKSRNLLVVGLTLVMLILMTSWASAQPAQQATATPEVSVLPTDTPAPTSVPTEAATATIEATAVAPAVSPLATPGATPAATPSTLPTTGGSDDGTAALSLLLMAAGALILVSVLGMAISRRPR